MFSYISEALSTAGKVLLSGGLRFCLERGGKVVRAGSWIGLFATHLLHQGIATSARLEHCALSFTGCIQLHEKVSICIAVAAGILREVEVGAVVVVPGARSLGHLRGHARISTTIGAL